MSTTRKLTKEELLAIVGGKADKADDKKTGTRERLMSTYACFVFHCTDATDGCGVKR